MILTSINAPPPHPPPLIDLIDLTDLTDLIDFDFDSNLPKLSPTAASSKSSVPLQVHTTCFYAIACKYLVFYTLTLKYPILFHISYFIRLPENTIARRKLSENEIFCIFYDRFRPGSQWVSLSPKSLSNLHIFAFQTHPILEKENLQKKKGFCYCFTKPFFG